MSLIKYLIDFIEKHKNSVRYWEKEGAIIGRNCDIHTSASLGSEPYLVTIGNYVRINAGVQIVTHDGGLWVVRRIDDKYCDVDIFKRVEIGDNVHIGTNVIILPGVRIGNNCIIGVGAVVTKDIPDNSVAVGIPARIIETIDDYIKKNEKLFFHTKNMTSDKKKDYLNKIFENKS